MRFSVFALFLVLLTPWSAVRADLRPFDPARPPQIAGGNAAFGFEVTSRILAAERDNLKSCPVCRAQHKCMTCDGTGKVKGSALSGGREVTCPKCGGTTICPVCKNGTRPVSNATRDSRYLAVDHAVKAIAAAREAYAAWDRGHRIELPPMPAAVASSVVQYSEAKLFDPSDFWFKEADRAVTEECRELTACPSCRGARRCVACQGKGKIAPSDATAKPVPCRLCNGTGVCAICANGTKPVDLTQSRRYVAIADLAKAFDELKDTYGVFAAAQKREATHRSTFGGLR